MYILFNIKVPGSHFIMLHIITRTNSVYFVVIICSSIHTQIFLFNAELYGVVQNLGTFKFRIDDDAFFWGIK